MTTLRQIERMGREAVAVAEECARLSYLAKYSVVNPWVIWLLAREAELLEQDQEKLCGWQLEETT